MEQWLSEFDVEKRLLESIPVVKRVDFHISDKSANLNKVLATLSCCWEPSRSSFKQVTECCDERSKLSHLEAMRALRAKIIAKHQCEGHEHHPQAVERMAKISAEAGSHTEAANETRALFDRIHLAQARLQSATRQATIAEKALQSALAAESEAVQARKVAQAKAKELRRAADLLQPKGPSHKKQKLAFDVPSSVYVHDTYTSVQTRDVGSTSSITAITEEHESDDQPTWLEWPVSRWRKHERESQKRRAVEIQEDSSTHMSLPPRGDETRGWRHHWRRGLIGTLQDWAEGSKFSVAFMLAEMAIHFKCELMVGERLGFALSAEKVKQAKTDEYIVDRLCAALSQLKQCRSVEEWQDYSVVLAAAAPQRETAEASSSHRDECHSITKVLSRLSLQRGARYVKAMGERRPRAADQAISVRAAFDEASKVVGDGRLKPGDVASSCGRKCTIIEIDYAADTCKLAFEVAGIKLTRSYSCIYKGKDAQFRARFPKGSARLRHVAPSLRHAPRETRKDEKAEAAQPKIEELFNAEGARSPSQRDHVRRRVGAGLYEVAQALFIYTTSAALYAKYLALYPANKISFSLFKRLRPWYVRRAKQETCLCKHCVNFKNYMVILHSLVKLFEPAVQPPTTEMCGDSEDNVTDTEVDSQADSFEGMPKLQQLLQFCGLQSKSDMCKFALCSGAFDGAGKLDCINVTCSRCGFDKIWSDPNVGLRRLVVDEDNSIRATAPVEFQSSVKWTRIRSSNKSNPGESQQPSYESVFGTVVQFLDQFERDVFRKFPHHRFTIQRQKAMAAEFERCRGPGWIQSDVDFAMDGEIPPPAGQAIQSDHWSPMTFTCFVQVVSWIKQSSWTSRTSELQLRAAVTVEAADNTVLGSIEPAEGSWWGKIVHLPSPSARASDPEGCLYGIMGFGAQEGDPPQMVARHLLRHRERKTKAFVHISNDKTHDSQAAQTFIDKTIDYIEQHYVKTGTEKFHAWHMHSDNAPSHFKSSQTMNYVTKLPARLATWATSTENKTFGVFWEFGAPGHGKGVWDGIGAWIKRTVRQDIVDHRPGQNKSVLTASGDILSPAHVAEHLKARFDNDEYIQKHLNATINQIVITYTDTREIQRVTTNKYTRMPGMKKTFLFMAVRDEVVLQRPFACWCPPCMKVCAPGDGMDSNYKVMGCTSGLQWKETVIAREDAAGVANARSRTRTHARSLRDQLLGHFMHSNTPVWVAVQNRGEDDLDQYWIGRATGIKVYTEAGSVDRVRYDAGDAEVTVEWFERDLSGGDERRIFKRWNTANADQQKHTFNSTELRAINVSMQLIPPLGGVPLNVVQHEARPARRAAAKQADVHRVQQQTNPLRANPRGLTSVVHKHRAMPEDQLWEIPTGDESRILEFCCP